MLFTDFDPKRDPDHGQIHVRLVHWSVEDAGDHRRSQQVGYWCDEAHAEHLLKALTWALQQAREHREGVAEQAAIDRQVAEARDATRREVAEEIMRRARNLAESSPGCDCGCKYAARELKFAAEKITEAATECVEGAVDAPF